MARQEINVNAVIEKAMQHKGLHAALAARRDQVKARAAAIMAAEGVAGELTTEEGVRPKGRPYARVTLDNADQEWGTSKTERRRILGRSR